MSNQFIPLPPGGSGTVPGSIEDYSFVDGTPAAISAEDNFVDTNGTDLEDHTMDIGTGWLTGTMPGTYGVLTPAGGVFSIQSNKTEGSGQTAAFTDVTSATGVFTATANMNSGLDFGFFVNFDSSTGDGILVYCYLTSLSIYKSNAWVLDYGGGLTVAATFSASTDYTAEITISGSSVRVVIPGASIDETFAATVGSGQEAGFYSPNGNAIFSDFLFNDGAGTAAVETYSIDATAGNYLFNSESASFDATSATLQALLDGASVFATIVGDYSGGFTITWDSPGSQSALSLINLDLTKPGGSGGNPQLTKYTNFA